MSKSTKKKAKPRTQVSSTPMHRALITEGKAHYINRKYVRIDWKGYDLVLWDDGHIGKSLPVKLVGRSD